MIRSSWTTLGFAAALAAAGVAGAALASSGGASGGGQSTMPSASAPAFDAAQEYREGADALKANNYKKAVQHLTLVSQAAPHNSDVWYVLGIAKSGAEDLKGAEKAYENSVHYNGDNVMARAELGLTEYKLNHPDKTKAQLSVLQQKAAACGSTCAQAADLKSAVDALQAVLTENPKPTAQLTPPSLLFADPSRGDSAYAQAVSLINQRRYQDALTELGHAEKAFGPHPDVLTYLGYTYRKMGQLDRAETYYREALSVAPHHRGATEYYGELKVERGDMAGARRMLAVLDTQCAFGCAEAETLRQWIQKGGDPGL